MLAKPWWWLLASIAHFLLHHGFTTKHTDGLVCLPPSNRAVRVKSEASKSKDTSSSSAAIATRDRAEATATLRAGKVISPPHSMYCPALPAAAGTAKARSLQNRSNNLVSRTCLPMSQSPTFWVKFRGCSACWSLSEPPEKSQLPLQ